TWGRVATAGVWPLAPSLDTVGPMAPDVAGVVAGMGLLEPGFAPAEAAAAGLGRFRLPGTRPVVDAAVDDALARCELAVTDVRLPGWAAAGDATLTVILAEAWESDRELLSDPEHLDDDVRAMIRLGGALPPADLTKARSELDGWKRELARAVERAGGVVALPTLLAPPPTLEEAARDDGRLVLATAPVNGAGFPALALPLRGPRGVPLSLQLVAAPGGEELLVATGAVIEAALR
ncbi:MAG: amidase family protein, partial [Acidimicrobiales bacterium]